MYGFKHLSKLNKECERIHFDDKSKIVLMSDCHRGDGNWSDTFFKNRNIFYAALNHYYKDNYTYIELGDGDELWENNKMSEIISVHKDIFILLSRFYKDNRLYFLYGNHDSDKSKEEFVKKNLYFYHDRRLNEKIPLFYNVKIHEGLVLRHKETKEEIFLVHGHQVDLFNHKMYWMKKFLVRYVWKPLELFGINDPTSPAKNYEKKRKVGAKLSQWAIEQNKMIIAGHTHRPVFPNPDNPNYFNDGSCVHPSGITAIEIAFGYILLIKWDIKAKEDGMLYVHRDILEGPVKVKDYYKSFSEIISNENIY